MSLISTWVEKDGEGEEKRQGKHSSCEKVKGLEPIRTDLRGQTFKRRLGRDNVVPEIQFETTKRAVRWIVSVAKGIFRFVESRKHPLGEGGPTHL